MEPNSAGRRRLLNSRWHVDHSLAKLGHVGAHVPAAEGPRTVKLGHCYVQLYIPPLLGVLFLGSVAMVLALDEKRVSVWVCDIMAHAAPD